MTVIGAESLHSMVHRVTVTDTHMANIFVSENLDRTKASKLNKAIFQANYCRRAWDLASEILDMLLVCKGKLAIS